MPHRDHFLGLRAAVIALIVAPFWFFASHIAAAPPKPAAVIRVGFFPNLTHAQALVGRANGDFQKALGPDVQLEWKAFNAGPSAIEALFANAIDLTYVGPNPTVAGYVRSEGAAVRVIAGATSGGASLVVREGSGIHSVSDFHGKRIGTPQQGNSQDISLRSWLRANGMKSREKGGDIQIFPISNAFQLTLFRKGELDAAWAPEPWASRLVHEGGGIIFLDERDLWPGHEFVATNLIARPEFLKEHPDLAKKFLRAHVDLTQWIAAHPEEAKTILNQQLKKDAGKALSAEVLNDAFARMRVTYDPIRASLLKTTQLAFNEGFLGNKQLDLDGLYDLTLLNEILQEKKERLVP
jgi:NitT/TauT family transport system substrate-binding protein